MKDIELKTFADVESFVEQHCLKQEGLGAYSLARIQNFLEKLDNPQNKIKVIHVAGTSGKTSVCYYITEMLKQNNYKIGLSISPHLVEVNERVQVNLVPLSEKEFCTELTEFIELYDTAESQLTYFEFFVAFGYWYFAKINADYVVMEVGLGGLLDATNVVNRGDKICVITDVGFDHEAILGNSLEEIAEQKAGIIQSGNEVFTLDQNKEIKQIIQKVAKTKKAKLHEVKTPAKLFQKRNFDLAKSVCEYIFLQDGHQNLSETKLKKISELNIPGRLEIIKHKNKTLILDGAHNAQKMRAMVQSLTSKFAEKSCATLVAISDNKKPQLLEMSRVINELSEHIILTQFEAKQDRYLKSIHPDYLREYFPDREIEIQLDLKTSFAKLLERQEEILLVTGSLYLVSDVRKLLR